MATIEIEKLARENEYFRREVATAEHSQVVVMKIQPGGERTKAEADAAEAH